MFSALSLPQKQYPAWNACSQDAAEGVEVVPRDSFCVKHIDNYYCSSRCIKTCGKEWHRTFATFCSPSFFLFRWEGTNACWEGTPISFLNIYSSSTSPIMYVKKRLLMLAAVCSFCFIHQNFLFFQVEIFSSKPPFHHGLWTVQFFIVSKLFESAFCAGPTFLQVRSSCSWTVATEETIVHQLFKKLSSDVSFFVMKSPDKGLFKQPCRVWFVHMILATSLLALDVGTASFIYWSLCLVLKGLLKTRTFRRESRNIILFKTWCFQLHILDSPSTGLRRYLAGLTFVILTKLLSNRLSPSGHRLKSIFIAPRWNWLDSTRHNDNWRKVHFLHSFINPFQHDAYSCIPLDFTTFVDVLNFFRSQLPNL